MSSQLTFLLTAGSVAFIVIASWIMALIGLGTLILSGSPKAGREKTGDLEAIRQHINRVTKTNP
jgi:hypothetical protein